MTCRLYIGVDDGRGIDAAFFRDQVSPEHALDVLTRCYPDSGAARAFVDTLGAARAPDDEDGPAADPVYLFNGLCAGLSRVCWPCYR